MDRSADACEDLYAYACGGWLKSNPIPPDQSIWNVYGKLHADNQHYLWGILEDVAKPRAERSSTQQKIGDYFAACMDVEALEKAGSAPLTADLARLEALQIRTRSASGSATCIPAPAEPGCCLLLGWSRTLAMRPE